MQLLGFPGGSVVENPPARAEGTGLIPGSGRSPGDRNGNPLQYSCLENLMDKGAWWPTTAHGVTKRVGQDLATKRNIHIMPQYYIKKPKTTAQTQIINTHKNVDEPHWHWDETKNLDRE